MHVRFLYSTTVTQAGLATWYIPVCECYQRESERIKEKEGDKKGGGGGGMGGEPWGVCTPKTAPPGVHKPV